MVVCVGVYGMVLMCGVYVVMMCLCGDDVLVFMLWQFANVDVLVFML